MRLLKLSDTGEPSLSRDWTDELTPPYAILSHTWGMETEEVTFQELHNAIGKTKPGYQKIKFCGEQARKDGLEYFWVDTCCIDKSNQNELSEAINSMFRWYANAAKCYVYLSDVKWNKNGESVEQQDDLWEPQFAKSRWFSRGWTLQELLASRSVVFFSREKQELGTKLDLLEHICTRTRIPASALKGHPLSEYSIDDRISWSDMRETSRKEDMAYSLLGICQVYMPPIYGEGRESAFRRLHNEIRQNDMRQDILNWISPTDYRQQQTDTFRTHHPGTGLWFLECQEFRSWIEGETRTLLCPGSPGASKTVMVSIIVDHLMRQFYSSKTPILYLYCHHKRQIEQHISHLLAALLRQLLYATYPIPQKMKDLYDHHTKRNTQLSLEELKRALETTCSSFSKVYIIIDALDECERKARLEMVDFLQMLRGKGTVQALITSRFVPEVQIDVEADSSQEIQATEVDIKAYLRSRIPELPKKVGNDSYLQDNVISTITEVAKGIFLLAQLYMDSLKHKRTIAAVTKALQNLPSEDGAYGTIYEDTMNRICGQVEDDRQIALDAIAWITLARRPLVAVELQHVLAIDPDSTDLDRDDIVDIDDILSLCKGLVVQDDQTKVVRLVHSTAEEYFERTWTRWNPDAEARLALKCVTYLSFDSFAEGPCKTADHLAKRFAHHVFYEYSADYWGEHVRSSEHLEESHITRHLQSASLKFVQNDKLIHSVIQTVHRPPFSKFRNDYVTSCLHLAALYGTTSLMKQLLSTGQIDFNAKDGINRTPLSVAVQWGHDAVVKILLETGQVDVNSKGRGRVTPLLWAARYGNRSTVKALLESGKADVNCRDHNKWTPLSWAARRGDVSMLKALLETSQADINSKDNNDWTPLFWAILYGHELIVRALLETGQADVNAKDKNGRTALLWAIRHGNKAMVKVLLETRQVNVNLKDKYGRTPLLEAVVYGYESVARTLFERGQADGVSVTKKRLIAQSWEANHGTELVTMLLETGLADVNSKDYAGDTPLSLVAKYGHTPTIKALIETGKIDLESRDNYGCTPLSLAAFSGHEAVVTILLETGRVDINSQNLYGDTPLLMGAQSGHEPIVKRLLETGGANIHLKNKFGHTPLSLARRNGHKPVVDTLLQYIKITSSTQRD